MTQSLAGAVAIVTGASRGIGAVIAARLAAEGAAVVAAARSTAEKPGRLSGTLDETVAAINASGGRAIAVPTDLADAGQREALVAEAEREFGRVDILVNNAAIAYFSPAAEFDLARAELMFAIGVHAPLHLSQLVLPGMRARGSGRICNLTSDVARHPRVPPSRWGAKGTTTLYGMCKAALERFSSGLAAEVHSDGVTVNAIGPSKIVPTPGTVFHGVTTEDNPDTERPEVLAEAVLRLCGKESAGVSGRVLRSQDFLGERVEVGTDV
ncbi:SDR family NAD(P)-dependent oxidoreductase [Amycolatopsis acidicola]|uniref:SDR family NAD(P)-dependent oxidoreductase n=1 Tax=Amycolatopsis acidicola TaxID=2596893 RepID=A0A5N0VEF0_9PSEU|nr:SDR family NAD(P)-dependent oxidoreductase [Amycolatopsis acidicola]KAA9164445.1 SDR family NAD(P)-dependent oxidoreductase [Amycolatopsis acidicola]